MGMGGITRFAGSAGAGAAAAAARVWGRHMSGRRHRRRGQRVTVAEGHAGAWARGGGRLENKQTARPGADARHLPGRERASGQRWSLLSGLPVGPFVGSAAPSRGYGADGEGMDRDARRIGVCKPPRSRTIPATMIECVRLRRSDRGALFDKTVNSPALSWGADSVVETHCMNSYQNRATVNW
jgi:hypothetical protein